MKRRALILLVLLVTIVAGIAAKQIGRKMLVNQGGKIVAAYKLPQEVDSLTFVTYDIYSVSALSSNPTLGSASVSSNSVEQGSTVTLTAQPIEGYKFANWTVNGEVVSPLNPYTTNVTDDIEFVANFAEKLINTEANILDITLPNESNVICKKVENDKVSVMVVPNSFDLTNINPSYTISEGAKIIGGNDNYDYSIPHELEVISEDGNLKKQYTIIIYYMPFPEKFNFDNWSENRLSSGVYDEAYTLYKDEYGIENEYYIWASGNMGYRITGKGVNHSDYPTFKTTDSREGEYAACLVTRYVGKIGQGSPLAAGNLFIGEFSGKGINIMKEQMKATRFGMPIDKKPDELKFWFKYKGAGQINIYNAAGEIIGVRTTDNDNSGNNANVENKDYAAVYAVMFDNKKAKELYNGKNYLDGETILSSPAEVGRAILTDNDKYGTPTDEAGNPNVWIEKSLKFVYSKDIDETKLKNYEYSLAIVFSSSYYGAEFQGAEGSKLWIDEVELVYEQSNLK